MRKILTLTLALTLVFALAACGSKAEPASPEAGILPDPAEEPGTTPPGTSSDLEAPVIGLPNPMVSYETLDEINEAVGCRLCTPAVMGVSDKAYFVITTSDGQMAETQFTVAGLKYSFRSAPVADHDISGLYIGESGTAFSGMEISDELQYAENASYKAARWFTIDGQYVLSVMDEGAMTKLTFLAIANELRSGTQPGMSESELTALYDALAGHYFDITSQRATAEITSKGSEGLHIVVSWGSSDSERDQWEMDARFTEDGLLSYPHEEGSNFITDSDGKVIQVFWDIAPVPGWFEFVDDQLLWTGARSDQCKTCVFEKVELSGDPLAPSN